MQPTRNKIGRAPISSLVDERNGCSRGYVETSGLAVLVWFDLCVNLVALVIHKLERGLSNGKGS